MSAVVFIDLVSFSKKATSDQKPLIVELGNQVRSKVKPLLSGRQPAVIALPTGDGMALAFLHDSPNRWNREMLFALVYKLQRWAYQKTTKNLYVALRFGIHTGSVETVKDINGRNNVCGATINNAQRVMDAANPRQVLLSETAFQEFVGPETNECLRPFHATFGPPVQVTAKHWQQLIVYPMRLAKKAKFWNNADPDAKWWLLVSPTHVPKEKDVLFRKRRSKAKEIALILLTGAGFFAEYEQARKRGRSILSQDLNRFWVFMPSPELYARMGGSIVSDSQRPLEYFVKKWRRLLVALLKERPNMDCKLGFYSSLGYYASYLDWSRKSGIIHVSPYIWGVPAKNSPGFDLHWQSQDPPPPYQKYLDGLNNLNGATKNILRSRANRRVRVI